MKYLLAFLFLSSIASASAIDDTCAVIEAAAKQNGLPVNYLTRLIWQESKFDSSVVSPAGAQGVAQFMPGTAYGRGLLNPFDPKDALFEAAAYLHELRASFGNLGLAAAAYNAGPGRLSRWLKGGGYLPQETINYVPIVTGHALEEWIQPTPPAIDSDDGFSCAKFAASAGTLPNLHPSPTPGQSIMKPWAVILAGTFRQGQVLAEFERLRRRYPSVLGDAKPVVTRKHLGQTYLKYMVMLTEDTRAQADKVCKRLEAQGGACIVLRSIVK